MIVLNTMAIQQKVLQTYRLFTVFRIQLFLSRASNSMLTFVIWMSDFHLSAGQCSEKSLKLKRWNNGGFYEKQRLKTAAFCMTWAKELTNFCKSWCFLQKWKCNLMHDPLTVSRLKWILGLQGQTLSKCLCYLFEDRRPVHMHPFCLKKQLFIYRKGFSPLISKIFLKTLFNLELF